MAVDPHAAIAVTPGFTWAAAAGWSTFIAVLGGIGLLVHRAGPFTTKLAEIIINRGDKIRGEQRAEELSDKQQLAVLSDRMTRMSGAFAFLANAVTVAVNGLASDDPLTRERDAQQARELVAMAVSTLGNEDPYVKALDRVASIPPIRRAATK